MALPYRIHLLFVFLGIFLLPVEGFTQRCKYDFDEKDPMTEVQIRRIDIKVTGYHIISFYRNGDQRKMVQNISFAGEENKSIAAGVPLKIKLTNGEIIELPSDREAPPVTMVSNMGMPQVLTRYTVEYPIDAENLTKIREHGFLVFSFSFFDNPKSVELKKARLKKTMEGARCIAAD